MKMILGLVMAVLAMGASAAEPGKEFDEKLGQAARIVSMDGHNKTSLGIIGELRASIQIKNTKRTKEAPKYLDVQVLKEQAMLQDANDAKQVVQEDHTALPAGGVVTRQRLFRWDGLAWNIGTIKFKNQNGFDVEIPLWTASEERARAYYLKNPFPQLLEAQKKAKW